MRVVLRILVLLLCSAGWPTGAAWGVALLQVDTFEDGTERNWTVARFGAVHPSPPANVPTGGPGGAGASYLLLTLVPPLTGGPGERLAVLNRSQWQGNYTAAGIGTIGIWLRNLGASDLSLRLLFSDAGKAANDAGENLAFSASAVALPAGSDWAFITFPILPEDLLAERGSVAAVLANTTELRIFHSPEPRFPPPDVVADWG